MAEGRQTLLSEHSEEGGEVGPKFSRSRIRDDLLPQDRRRLRNILPYIESAMNGYRGALISCLVRTGHPSAADELRGLTIERFVERARDIRIGMEGRPTRCWRWLTRVELMRDRRDNLRELIERSLGLRGMSNRDVLELADELFDEEIEFAEMLAEDLREVIGTERALNRARRVDSLKERAKEKEEEIGDMYPKPVKLVRAPVRIYNQELTPAGNEKSSPEGKFQVFYKIDALADISGRVQEWELSEKEITVCKHAFIHYWWLKGGEETKEGRDMEFYSDKAQTKLSDYPARPEETPEGVVMRGQPGTEDEKVQAKYWGSGSSKAPAPVVEPAMGKEELAEQVSERMNKPVKRLDIGDLVVGMSAGPLEEVSQPEGVLQTKALVIDPETGQIDFVDTRSYSWRWENMEADLQAARQELKRKGII